MPLERDLGRGARGSSVNELHAALRFLQDLSPFAEVLTSRRRPLFEREVAASDYGDVTAELIAAFQASRRIQRDGELLEPTRHALIALLRERDWPPLRPVPSPPQDRPDAPSEPGTHGVDGSVAGTVFDRFTGRAGLLVVLENIRAGGSAQILARTETGTRGDYSLTYDHRAASQALGRLSLRVAALDAQGQARLAQSPVIHDAPPAISGLDLHIEAEAPAESEFHRILRDAKAAAAEGSIDLHDAEESEDRPDISLIAAQTGHPPTKVALTVAALRTEKLSRGGVSAELVYALASEGVPFGAVALADSAAEGLKAKTSSAVERGLVSAAAIEAIEPALRAAKRSLAAANVRGMKAGPIGARLLRAAGEETALDKFIDAAASHRGAPDKFWARMEADPALANQAARLRLAIEMSAIAGADDGTVGLVQRLAEDGRIGGFDDLAHLTSADWEHMLGEAGIEAPGVASDMPAATRDPVRAAYARGLEMAVEASRPTLFARARLAASSLARGQEVADFLRDAPGFTLGASRLTELRGADAAAAARLPDDTKKTLEALDRVVRVTRRIGPAIGLVENGLESAHAIAAMGPLAFARQHEALFGGTKAALAAHGAATFTATAAAELLVQIAPAHPQTLLSVLPPQAATKLGIPDWPTVFGAEDLCACLDCRSMTSASAYLVDLLQFLKKRAPKNGLSPLEALLARERRPDIAQTELSCENSDTVIRYMDLVVELLADAVAPPPSFPATAPTIAGPVDSGPGGRITPALRQQLDEALGYSPPASHPAGAPWAPSAFALSPDAMLTLVGEDQPVVAAARSWRVDDGFATYILRDDGAGTIKITARLRSTRGPSEDRLLHPQYENQEAFRRLAAAYYPWNLPFDRPRTEARAGLAALGSSLAQALEATGPGPAAQRRASGNVVAETLGLSPMDAALVTEDSTTAFALDLAEPWRHWGFGAKLVDAVNPIADPEDATQDIASNEDWAALLARRVDVLLQQGQFDYAALLALIDTAWVNPLKNGVRSLHIVSTDPADPATCRLRDLAVDGLDADCAMRMARMMRLARRSGLELREIDTALKALGTGDLDASFLRDLSLIQRLRDRLGVDWEEVCAWLVEPKAPSLAAFYQPPRSLRPVDTQDEGSRFAPSLYERLFARPAVAAIGDLPPAPEELTADPADIALALARAFGTAPADIAKLAAAPEAAGGGVAGFAKIALVHRHAGMMRATGLTAEEHLAALRLFGPDIFASPVALGDYLECVERVLASGVGIGELAWLARGETGLVDLPAPDVDVDLLDTLRAALRQAESDNRFVATGDPSAEPTRDVSGELLRAKLHLLGWPDPLVTAVSDALSDSASWLVQEDSLPGIDPAAIERGDYSVPLAVLPAGLDPGPMTGGKVSYDASGQQLKSDGLLDDPERASLTAAAPDAEYQAAVAALLVAQDNARGRARWDPEAKRLTFSGPMSLAWRKHLDGISSDPAWRAAIAELFDAPRRALKRLLGSFALGTAATPLAAPPPMRLPRGLDGRLFHDRSVAPAMLRQIGPLLPGETASLKAAAGGSDAASAAFRAALDTLDAAVDGAAVAPGDQFFAASAIDALLEGDGTAELRRLAVLEKLLPRVADQAAAAGLAQSLSTGLQVPPATAAALCDIIHEPGGARSAAEILRAPDFAASSPSLLPNDTAFPLQHDLLRLLRRAAMLITRTRLTAADFPVISRLPGWPDLSLVPLAPLAAGIAAPVPPEQLLRVADYARLRDRLRRGAGGLADIVAAAAAAGATLDSVAGVVAAELRRAPEEVAAAAGASLANLGWPATAGDERTLLQLVEMLDSLDRLGLSPSSAIDLRAGDMAFATGRAMIDAAVRSQPADLRGDMAETLSNATRSASRDALVALLLARGRPAENGYSAKRWRRASDLTRHFLIDVEMGDCMETSRLLQAILSTQMFIQLCRQGEIDEVNADPQADDGWLQYEWLSRQTLRAANLETWLYPENLLIPDIRDDRSQLFREFEGDIGQGELTPESAARAILAYLTKLKRLENVQPVSNAVETTASGDVHHLVAMIPGDPPEYHYRRRDWTKRWTPWEKVTLEIRSGHVFLKCWRGRTFLFWIEMQRQDGNASLDGDSVKTSIDSVWNLLWSELIEGKWTPQRRSRDTLSLRVGWEAFADPGSFVCRVGEWGGALHVGYRFNLPGLVTPEGPTAGQAWFRVEYPHAEPRLEDAASFRLPPALPGAWWGPSGQAAGNGGKWQAAFSLSLPVGGGSFATALAAMPGGAEIVMPSDLKPASLVSVGRDVCDQPFLVRDAKRTFFVTPLDQGSVKLVDKKPSWYVEAAARVQIDKANLESRFIVPDFIVPTGPRPAETPNEALSAQGARSEIAGVAASFRAGEAALAARIRPDEAAIKSFNETKPATGLLNLIGLPGLAAAPQTLSVTAIPAHAAVRIGASRESAALAASPSRDWGVDIYVGDSFSLWFNQGFKYRFESAYVPHVDTLINTLLREGVEAMLARDVQLRPFRYGGSPSAAPLAYASTYGAVPSVVSWSRAKESFDFDFDSFSSTYLWEIFYHIPSLLADRYLAGHRFEDALRMNQTIVRFSDQSKTVALDDGSSPAVGVARYWQTKPLFLNSLDLSGQGDTVIERERIGKIVSLLSRGPDAQPPLTDEEQRDADRFRLQVEENRRHPYQPFRIARLRTSAFQRAAAMREIQIRLAWGDELFRRDTMESVNAAMLHYLAAADFRGRSAETVPPRAISAPQTFATLEDKLGDDANALVAIEAFVSPSAAAVPSGGAGVQAPSMLAFCIPPNRKLEGLWSAVTERLYRLRNCMNIDGVRRRLALFEPRIDPELLARAVAGGIDISEAISDISGPMPRRRFRALLAQALSLAAEVRELDAKLWSATEKRDAEVQSLQRATNERLALERAVAVMKIQEREAKAQVDALVQSREGPLLRLAHFQRLLGESGAPVPEGARVQIRPARRDTATHAPQLFKLSADLGAALQGFAASEGQAVPINTYEDFELSLQAEAQGKQQTASALDTIAAIAHIIPNWNMEPLGAGATFGGANVGSALAAAAAAVRAAAGEKTYAASVASRFGQFATRADEWILQRNGAALELMSIDKQLATSRIAFEAATQRLADGKLQVEESRAIEAVIRDKPTNASAYNWIIGRLSQAHFSLYRLAFDAAKRLQRRARFELANPDLDLIRSGQWRGERGGLTAGEALGADLRALEAAFEDAWEPEQAIIQHVSLAQVDPAALVRLRATGSATVAISETLLDLAHPGDYMRKLVDVAVTVPCVTGPYTGVHLKLTLLRSATRMSSALAGKKGAYARLRDREDARFVDVFTPTRSIVTSSGREDDGQAQMPREEGYDPPFAGMGAIGTWRLELPGAFRNFDYETITDVILRLRYTARPGDERFRNQCEAELKTALGTIDEASSERGLNRLFSLRHEEPSAWRSFLEQPAPTATMQLPIRRERLPYFVAERPVEIRKVRLFAHVDPARASELKNLVVELKTNAGGQPEALTFQSWLPGILVADWEGRVKLAASGAKPDGSWTLAMSAAAPATPLDLSLLSNLELLATYGFA